MPTLSTQPRSLTKGARNTRRRQGHIPAVVYGKGRKPHPIMVEEVELRQVLKAGGRHKLIHLQGPGVGEDCDVLIKDLQVGMLDSSLVHVDFHQPAAGERVRIQVPVVLVGEDELAGQGVLVERQLSAVECQCSPERVPDALYVDVTAGRAGGEFTVGEISSPPGVKILGNPEMVVVSLRPAMATIVPGEGTAAVATQG